MGSVAEWSKALVLGTSLFGGVGSNPTVARFFAVATTFVLLIEPTKRVWDNTNHVASWVVWPSGLRRGF